MANVYEKNKKVSFFFVTRRNVACQFRRVCKIFFKKMKPTFVFSFSQMTQRASLSFDIKKKRERKGNEIQREMKNKCDLISIFIFS